MNFRKDDSPRQFAQVRSFRDSNEGECIPSLVGLPSGSMPVLSGNIPSLLSLTCAHTLGLLFFRLLLQLTQSQQTSFALERNLRTQQEIADKMKEFGFKEDTLLLIAEVSVHINP